WHVRAYCHIDRKFKDFILSRCLECRIAGPAELSSEQDTLWQERFLVRLTPNPLLSKSQQAIIAADYSMDNNILEVPVRRALLYYFQKRLRLDVAEIMDDLNATPVIVQNRDELETALAEATA